MKVLGREGLGFHLLIYVHRGLPIPRALFAQPFVVIVVGVGGRNVSPDSSLKLYNATSISKVLCIAIPGRRGCS